MLGQRTIALQRRQMRRRAVALVLREAVFGIPLMQRIHFGIARGFGKNRRGGNGGDFGIAFHHRFGGHRQIGRHAVAVYPHFFRLPRQRGNGAAHGKHRGVQNIQPLDFGRIGGCHRPCGCLPFDLRRQRVALGFAEFFGIG